MRRFSDSGGAEWTASVHEEDGYDYKGRYSLVMVDESGTEVALEDVRWNTERTAHRTLQTMSETELRRRLRSARGRRAAQIPA